jgi:Neuraminidase (sialidase)
MSTSTNGKNWTKAVRIPIDPLSSTVDHFIPGLAVDLATSGKTAHLAVTYYYYPQADCNDSTCQINVGFTTSQDGGKTWTAGKNLAGPMKISWLPGSQNGPMLADYLSSSYVNGKAFGVFMVAKAPSGGLLNQAAYTNKSPLEASAGEPRFSSRGEKRIPNIHADRPYPRTQGEERESTAPPSK